MRKLKDLIQNAESVYDQEVNRIYNEHMAQRRREEAAEKEKQRRAEEAKQREISNYRSAQAREAREEMNALASIPLSIVLIFPCIFAGSIAGLCAGCGENYGLGVTGAIIGGFAGIGLLIHRYDEAKKK